MSIDRLKDGGYRIRYYENGTKGSPQRQETLRGLTFAEKKSRKGHVKTA